MKLPSSHVPPIARHCSVRNGATDHSARNATTEATGQPCAQAGCLRGLSLQGVLVIRTSWIFALAVAALATQASAADTSAAATGSDAATTAALAVLKQEEGVWDAAIEFPPGEAGKEATHATGEQTTTFVTGDRWIKNDFAVDAKYGGHGTWV